MKIERNGFSEISFPLTKYLHFKNIWLMIITKLTEVLVDISPKGSKTKKVFIITKIQYTDGSYKSIGQSVKLTLDSQFIHLLLKYIQNILSLRSNDYNVKEAQVNRIIFNFFFINPKFKEDKLTSWLDLNDFDNKVKDMNLNPFKISNKLILKLPTNNDYSSWGTVLTQSSVNLVVKLAYMPSILAWNKETNIVSINDVSFTDSITPEGVTFSNGTKVYIREGKIVLITRPIKTEYIQPLDYVNPSSCKNQADFKQKVLNKQNRQVPNLSKIGTFDIETVVREGIHMPYLYSFFDGVKHFSWFASSGSDLLKHLLKSNTYRNYTVFAHNLSRFDIVFLLRDIARLKEDGYIINIIKKEDKIISITITHSEDKNVKLTFKDSLLLLPSSLDKLSKTFKLEVGKLIQPVYVGKDHDEYKDSNLAHFKKEVEQIDSFEEWQIKAKEYCQQDCKALYDVLVHFIKMVWDRWQVSPIQYPTTPSLAFAIYRKKYLTEDTIPITKGEVFSFIRKSFTGGSTEMYKPNAINKTLYCYDANSLYPSVMAMNKFPTGKIFAYEGDITILDN